MSNPFKGFANLESPVCSVILPQAGVTYNVRSLTVAEVSKLKSSLVTATKANILLNDLIYKSIENLPRGMNLEQFKKSTTTLDREALLYASYHSTFGGDRQFEVSCSSCGKEQLIKIDLDRSFSFEAYPGSQGIIESYKLSKALDDEAPTDPEIEKYMSEESDESDAPKNMPKELAQLEGLNTEKIKGTKGTPPSTESFSDIVKKRIEVELAPTLKVFIKQPTLWDEEEFMKNIAFASKKQNDSVGEIIVIDRFEEYNAGDKTPFNVITNKDDILYGYQSLPQKYKTEIFDRYTEEFGKYSIKLEFNYECSSCGADNEINLEIARQFFRLVSRS